MNFLNCQTKVDEIFYKTKFILNQKIKPQVITSNRILNIYLQKTITLAQSNCYIIHFLVHGCHVKTYSALC